MEKCESCALTLSVGNKGGIHFLASTMKMMEKITQGEGRIVSLLLGQCKLCTFQPQSIRGASLLYICMCYLSLQKS